MPECPHYGFARMNFVLFCGADNCKERPRSESRLLRQRLAKPSIEKFGGEYLARGGRMTLRETDLWSPTRLVLVRFPDVETANRCLDSLDYQQILPISKKSARRTAVILEGE